MRGISIRQLLPAAVVSIVLVFAYVAPAMGIDAPPVKSSEHTNCGRFGYGYHGGKHNFACRNTEAPAPAVVSGVAPKSVPALRSASPVQTPRSGAVPQRSVVTSPVNAELLTGVTQWRQFAAFLLRELSSS